MLPDTRQRLEEAFRELQGLVVSRALGLVGWVARTCWCCWLLFVQLGTAMRAKQLSLLLQRGTPVGQRASQGAGSLGQV